MTHKLTCGHLAVFLWKCTLESHFFQVFCFLSICARFEGHSEFDQMMKIVEVQGIPPSHILAAGSKTTKFFEMDERGLFCLLVII